MSTPDDSASAPGDFNALIGVELLEIADEEARAQIAVAPKLLQPFGIVHGGVFASLAETLTSYATWLAVHDQGMTAMGQANQTSFLRPISKGIIHALARPLHRGRTTWVWDVSITDDEERLCATVRMTIAVRPDRTTSQPR